MDIDFIMGGWHEMLAPGSSTVYNSAWAREGLTDEDGKGGILFHCSLSDTILNGLWVFTYVRERS